MGNLKAMLLAGAALAGLALPAHATLQIAFTDGTNTFTCADGQLGCDLSGGANNLLTLNTNVGNFTVFGTLSASQFGSPDSIDLSSFGVINNGLASGTLRMILSDTGFIGPISGVTQSASLTFHSNVGAPASTLAFYIDPANVQGAGVGLVVPGTLLTSVSGTALTNPDSFSGTQFDAFSANTPFSLTETADIVLRGGGSITGFDQSMVTTSVPEASTWVMAGLGFAFLGAMAGFKRKTARSIFA